MDNYFEVLGIVSTIDLIGIKKAYVSKCLSHHPDKTSDPEKIALFPKIQMAYETLMDPVLRERHKLDLMSSSRNAIHETVDIEELQANPNNPGMLFFTCKRCCCCLEISEESFLDNDSVIIECEACSLNYNIIL